MSAEVSFNYNSGRARKARWGRHWARTVVIVDAAFLLALVAIAAYAAIHHHALGYTALGLAVMLAMLFIWVRGDVEALPAAQGALNTQTVRLERTLESNLLARLQPQNSLQQLWLAAASQWEGVFLLRRLEIPADVLADFFKKQAPAADPMWAEAVSLCRQLNLEELDSGVVIAATLLAYKGLLPVLQHLKLKPTDVVSVLSWQQRVKQSLGAAADHAYFGGIGRDWASGYTPLLSRYAVNISKQVERGNYRHAPSVHSQVVLQLAQQLEDNTASALVGGVGSGRTTIVYALAERMLRAEHVGKLRYYQVMSLNASVLISSGAKLESIMLRLLSEAVAAGNIIIFLDEAQLFFNAGPGSIDLSQILLPILQQNTIKIICALTEHDWQFLVSHQPALAAAMRRIVVPEPSAADTVPVVQDAAIGLEIQAKALVLQRAVTESVRLAERYLPEVAFPGKAIGVLESAAHYPQGKTIAATSVQQAVQATTGAQVTEASEPERQQLLELETNIHQRMINQTRAVKVVADALRRSRAGVGSPQRPVGSFLFLGPTGVGKTELAKALAAIYYGGATAMVRLDMSEYQQQSDLARLLAPSSAKQAGATLVSGVRQRPSTVVLLDEIEKAHPDILNVLLQVLDEGHLTDSDGRTVSFKDAIVIATSNAAADDIRARITKGEQLEAFEATIVDQLISSHAFRPELLNRFDEIVLFRPLTKPELRQVVNLMLGDVNATLQEQQVGVALTDAAADWLVDQGYDPALGARPLRRMVQRTVENVVADRLLAGQITAGQHVTLDLPDLVPAAAQPASASAA